MEKENRPKIKTVRISMDKAEHIKESAIKSGLPYKRRITSQTQSIFIGDTRYYAALSKLSTGELHIIKAVFNDAQQQEPPEQIADPVYFRFMDRCHEVTRLKDVWEIDLT